MKLDKRQFCIAVDTYKTMLEEENQIIDFLDISPNWKCSEWINNYYVSYINYPFIFIFSVIILINYS